MRNFTSSYSVIPTDARRFFHYLNILLINGFLVSITCICFDLPRNVSEIIIMLITCLCDAKRLFRSRAKRGTPPCSLLLGWASYIVFSFRSTCISKQIKMWWTSLQYVSRSPKSSGQGVATFSRKSSIIRL